MTKQTNETTNRFKIYDEEGFEITPYITNQTLCELLSDIIKIHARKKTPTRSAYLLVDRYKDAFKLDSENVCTQVKIASAMRLEEVASKFDKLASYFSQAAHIEQSDVLFTYSKYKKKLKEALFSLMEIFDDLT